MSTQYLIANTHGGEFVGNLGEFVGRWCDAMAEAERIERERRNDRHNGKCIRVMVAFENFQTQEEWAAWNRANPPQWCNYLGQPN